MVFSELAAATLIAVCGLKNSYRIILKSERAVRRRIRRPSPILPGYDELPRSFIRRIFRAGLVIAMKWEGRAKNAAQIAADARLRARKASNAVAKGVEDVQDRAIAARKRAQDVRERAQQRAVIMREHAEQIRQKADDVRTHAQDRANEMRKRASEMKEKVEQVKDRAVAAKDRVVELKNTVRDKISPKTDNIRKYSTSSKTLAFPDSERQYHLIKTRV